MPGAVPTPQSTRSRKRDAFAMGHPAVGATYTVGVRMKFGEEQEGLAVHEDGMTFRSPAPIQPGKMVELIVCRGSILVDALVVQCTPMQDGRKGYSIRTRYHHVSEALSTLIQEEVHRITGQAPPTAQS